MRYTLTVILFTLCFNTLLHSQGKPPVKGNGNPPLPPNYCQQFPNDPICKQYTQIPIGDWKWQLGVFILGSIMGIYFLEKKRKVSKIK